MTGLAPAAILWLLFAVGLAAAYSPLPRRPEPTSPRLGSSRWDDDDGDYTDEHGTVRRPGEEPREVGLP